VWLANRGGKQEQCEHRNILADAMYVVMKKPLGTTSRRAPGEGRVPAQRIENKLVHWVMMKHAVSLSRGASPIELEQSD
tara:strand:+ start:2909 stop:3145 length:237 start_codon:yes stop_codon:yes gene_type:complete